MENKKYDLESEQKEFFDKIHTELVSKEVFIEKAREYGVGGSDEEILSMRGGNFTDNEGNIIILMCKEFFPEKYLPYLEAHEKWEAYIARKEGFNLWDRSKRRFQEKVAEKLETPIPEYEEVKQEHWDTISDYNFDFRHEFAVWKEYQLANKDGKVDEYHHWAMTSRTEEEKKTESDKNDTKIRESIFKKIKEGKGKDTHKHSFIAE
jgi:hypothetical protein